MDQDHDQDQGFSVDVDVIGPETVVHLRGELDLRAAPYLRDRILEEAKRGCERMVLDLEALSFMDSVGLGVVLAAMRAMNGLDGEVVLQDPSPMVQRILEISGLTSVMPVLSTSD